MRTWEISYRLQKVVGMFFQGIEARYQHVALKIFKALKFSRY